MTKPYQHMYITYRRVQMHKVQSVNKLITITQNAQHDGNGNVTANELHTVE